LGLDRGRDRNLVRGADVAAALELLMLDAQVRDAEPGERDQLLATGVVEAVPGRLEGREVRAERENREPRSDQLADHVGGVVPELAVVVTFGLRLRRPEDQVAAAVDELDPELEVAVVVELGGDRSTSQVAAQLGLEQVRVGADASLVARGLDLLELGAEPAD